MPNINAPHDDIPNKIAEKVCSTNNSNDAVCERNAGEKRNQLTDMLSKHGKAEAVFKAVEELAQETGIDKMKILASLNLLPLEKITTDIHPKGRYQVATVDKYGRGLEVFKGYISGEEKIRNEMGKNGIYEINIKVHPQAAGDSPDTMTSDLVYHIGKKPELLTGPQDEYNIYKDFYTKRIVYYVGDRVKNIGGGPMQIQKL